MGDRNKPQADLEQATPGAFLPFSEVLNHVILLHGVNYKQEKY
jgi:hypothetical protein